MKRGRDEEVTVGLRRSKRTKMSDQDATPTPQVIKNVGRKPLQPFNRDGTLSPCMVVMTKVDKVEVEEVKREFPNDLTASPSVAASAGPSPARPPRKHNKQLLGATETTPLKAEKNQSDSESDDEIDYETRRQQNIEDNAKFLAQLGIMEAKAHLDLALKKPKTPKPSMNGLGKIKEKAEPLPRRQSLRIRRIDPEGKELPEVPVVAAEPYEEHPRKPSGPLQMTEYVRNVDSEEDRQAFIDSLSSLGDSKVKKGPDGMEQLSQPEVMSRLKGLQLTESCVAKLVPQRIFSVAVYPGEDRLLAAAGGKWGELGLWDMTSRLGPHDGVYCFTPHSRPVNHLRFHPRHPHQLYSCSYDGTLRRADLHTGVFEEAYVTSEDYDTRLNCFDFLSDGHTLVAAQSDGCVAMLDMRTGTSAEHEYPTHSRSVRCVNVHPTQRHYMVTASPDSTVCIWDTRKMCKSKAKPLEVLAHSKSVDSAYFSPLTGDQILTTSMDDRIRVFDSSDMTQVKIRASVRHNNHTGRWLTNFRAAWHPSREDIFVVGSMERPRRIELFDNQCKMLHTYKCPDHLNSVCSLNAFHPTRDVLVGGNSSGRLHVFM